MGSLKYNTKRSKKNNGINRWGLPYPCSPENEGFIYKITEKSTGRFYIGKKSFWRRSKTKGKVQSNWRTYGSSSKALKNLMQIHGVIAFDFEVLHISRTMKALNYYEMHYQIKYNAILDKRSFNINLGGTRIRMK